MPLSHVAQTQYRDLGDGVRFWIAPGGDAPAALPANLQLGVRERQKTGEVL